MPVYLCFLRNVISRRSFNDVRKWI